MSNGIDEAWEYYTADPEIEEVIRESGKHMNKIDCVRGEYAEDAKDRDPGMRFGRGDPNNVSLHLGREKVDQRTVCELTPRECQNCGGTFQPDRASRKYCSKECVPHPGRAALGKDTLHECLHCGKAFTPPPQHKIQRYCSRPCSQQHRSEDTKHGLQSAQRTKKHNRFRELWVGGVSLAEIGAKLEIAIATAKRWRAELGLAPRPVGNHSGHRRNHPPRRYYEYPKNRKSRAA